MAVSLPQLRFRSARELKSLRPSRAGAFSNLGIESVLDVLTCFPRRVIDRSRQATIADARPGESATLLVDVRSSRLVRGRGKPRVEVMVGDGTGTLKLTFFNQPWRTKQLPEGMTDVLIFGKVDVFRGARQMVNPIVDLVGDQTGRIVPVYPQSDKEGVTSREIARVVSEALRRSNEFLDPVPVSVLRDLHFPDRTSAFREMHQPSSTDGWQLAKRRLAFDELLRLQLMLVLRKRALERDAQGIRHVVDRRLVAAFLEKLPFALTGAQERAISEIEGDLLGPHPMHRLLQGDVGSGKTLVAACALLTAVQGGYQGALMAPTEVLAEQHHLVLRGLLGELSVADQGTIWGDRPVRVELLTNRTSAPERARIHAGLLGGEVDVLVGTHALLTEAVAFKALGVVVIDEQHRFGVEQRAALRDKGGEAVPDVLVMTATPIPRTAAMTVYGDLDVTTLNEMPEGRKPVRTVWARGPLEQQEAWERVRTEIGAGHQAYVVCPLVEESERVQARSATEEYERLKEGELAGLRLGLLHGQMTAKDKEVTMSAFRAGSLDAVVATTVIEVGVDVPNATVMVVLDADRFGLAQLHQLRGRVGRGGDDSWCYLLSDSDGEEAIERLKAFSETNDGFLLAEIDLEQRGEGTILGARQKGRSDLKLASLRRDRDLVEQARAVAFALVDDDPTLSSHELLRAEIEDLLDDEEVAFLFKS